MIRHCRLCKNFCIANRDFSCSNEAEDIQFDYNEACCCEKKAKRLFSQFVNPKDRCADNPYDMFFEKTNYCCPYFQPVEELIKVLSGEIQDHEYLITADTEYYVISRQVNNGVLLLVDKKLIAGDNVLFIGKEDECLSYIQYQTDVNLYQQKIAKTYVPF